MPDKRAGYFTRNGFAFFRALRAAAITEYLGCCSSAPESVLFGGRHCFEHVQRISSFMSNRLSLGFLGVWDGTLLESPSAVLPVSRESTDARKARLPCTEGLMEKIDQQ